MPLTAGQSWAGYRIERHYGSGSSDVYLASRDGHPFILKILSDAGCRAPSAVTAWLTDARVRGLLDLRPYAPRCLGYWLAPQPYSVSEFIAGETLGRALHDPSKRAQAFTAVAENAEALALRGVVPADLYPHNWVLREDGRAVYVDCGVVGVSRLTAHEVTAAPQSLETLRQQLGAAFYALHMGHEAEGRWTALWTDVGLSLPARPRVDQRFPERAHESAMIERLLRAEPALPPTEMSLADTPPLNPAPSVAEDFAPGVEEVPFDGFALDRLCIAARERGIDCVRISRHLEVDALGLTHLTKVDRGLAGKRGPEQLRAWLDLQALTATPALLISETSHTALNALLEGRAPPLLRWLKTR